MIRREPACPRAASRKPELDGPSGGGLIAPPATMVEPARRSLGPMTKALTSDELAFLHGVLDLAREGRADELGAAISRGVPVNLTGPTGDSLLMLAAYHDHPATVRLLLERGAQPDRVNDRGQTALGAAVFRRSEESVRLLLDHGASVHAGGRSAAQIAEFFGLDEMAALLAARP
jgi:ankyrin repeat protein